PQRPDRDRGGHRAGVDRAGAEGTWPRRQGGRPQQRRAGHHGDARRPRPRRRPAPPGRRPRRLGAAGMEDRPRIELKPGAQRRSLAGHPWVYSNEIAMDAAAKALEPGALVRLVASDGRPLGTYGFNPHTLIAARRLSRDPAAVIDAGFI